MKLVIATFNPDKQRELSKLFDLEGVVWSLDCLEDASNIEQLATALRRLHGLPLTGRTFDALGAARAYAGRISDPDTDRVRECLEKIEAGPLPPNLCCCHNDLVVENIINTPETRFLDWEYACDNDSYGGAQGQLADYAGEYCDGGRLDWTWAWSDGVTCSYRGQDYTWGFALR